MNKIIILILLILLFSVSLVSADHLENLSVVLKYYWYFDHYDNGYIDEVAGVNLSNTSVTNTTGKLGSAGDYNYPAFLTTSTSLTLDINYTINFWLDQDGGDTLSLVVFDCRIGADTEYLLYAGGGSQYWTYLGAQLSTIHPEAGGFNMWTLRVNSSGMEVFRNGGFVTYETGSITDITDCPIKIGNYESTESGRNIEGVLDEFGMWNRSLTNEEIAQLNNSGDGLPFSEFGGGVPPTSGAPAVPVFVFPTPADNAVNNSNQTINFTHGGTDVQFYLWVNESLFFDNITGVATGDGSLYVNFTTNFSDGNYLYKIAVQNITNGLFSSNVSRTFTLGSIPPTLTLNSNNLFLGDNSTIVYADFGWLNITLTDDSDLDSFLINITRKGTNEVMFNFTNDTLTGFKVYTFEYNLSTLPFINGTYIVDVWGSDTHTAFQINNYGYTTKNREINYDTAEGNHIQISTNEDAATKTTKSKDRYDFEFTFADKEIKTREFTLKANVKIKYINGSRYKAHFVIRQKGAREGNWVDFEGLSGIPTVIKVNDWEYKIIFDNVPDKVTFNSIGGLNFVNKVYEFDFFTADRVTLISRDVLTDEYTSQLNYTVTDTTRGNVTSFLTGDNLTLNLTGLRQGIYNVSIIHSDYATLNSNFEITTNPTETFIFDLSVVATINLFDEATGVYFNVSSADDIEFHVFCSNETIITDLIANISSVPITCEYTKLRFVVTYGTDTYYRTLIIPFSEATNISAYLINLDTTTSVFNSLIVDDLFQAYDNPSIYVFRTITSGTKLITSDFVDVENKIGFFAIENAEYNIVVNSDNQPAFVFGSYIAAEAGDKALRLYDFDVTPTPSGWSIDVVYSTQIMNLTGNDIAGNKTIVTFYNDSGNGTTNLVWTIYEDEIGGNILVTSTLADTLDATFIYDIPAIHNTTQLAVELIITHTSGEHKSTIILQEVTEIILGIENYINSQFLNWFITLLLALIAIISTIRTSDVITFVILGLAAVFIMFGWYKVSWSILILCVIISLIYFLKKQSDRPVGSI